MINKNKHLLWFAALLLVSDNSYPQEYCRSLRLPVDAKVQVDSVEWMVNTTYRCAASLDSTIAVQDKTIKMLEIIQMQQRAIKTKPE